jgi:hypothetical protein
MQSLCWNHENEFRKIQNIYSKDKPNQLFIASDGPGASEFYRRISGDFRVDNANFPLFMEELEKSKLPDLLKTFLKKV